MGDVSIAPTKVLMLEASFSGSGFVTYRTFEKGGLNGLSFGQLGICPCGTVRPHWLRIPACNRILSLCWYCCSANNHTRPSHSSCAGLVPISVQSYELNKLPF